MRRKRSVAKTELDIVCIGAKEVDKTSIILKMKGALKGSLGCHEVLFKEYTAERKDDVLFVTSPHEDGFITGDGSILALKGDIFVVMFKASADSQSFIEAAMLLELLLPLQKHRVILLGDSSGVPPEKRVERKEDMNRKTKAQMGVRYFEISCEDSEGLNQTSRKIVSITQRYIFKKPLGQRITQLFTENGRPISTCDSAKMYIAAKYPYNEFYLRSFDNIPQEVKRCKPKPSCVFTS